MKNKKKIILLTLPLLIVVILGSLALTKTVNLTKILGLVNPMDLKSSDVPYTNNSQSTVQGAIDDLYTKASKWVNPNDMGTPQYYAYGQYKGWCASTDTSCNSYADFPTTSTTPPSGKNVYTAKYEDGQYGVCIKRNGTEHCFRARNYKAEAKHIQEVFSDISCNVSSNGDVDCDASDFDCLVGSDGYVDCIDFGNKKKCFVLCTGEIICYE